MEPKKKPSKTKEDLSVTHNLTNLIEYQKGSVVSRTLINRKTGTITLFSFDKGEGLSEHIAPFDAMVLVLDGTAEINISGKANIVKGGEMIVLPVGKPHSLKAIEKFKMILIMIKSDN
jgi:quercetin dioxygenase-like cupin family protein